MAAVDAGAWADQLAEMTVLDAVYGLDGSFTCTPPLAGEGAPPTAGCSFAGDIRVAVELPEEGVWLLRPASDGSTPSVAQPSADGDAPVAWDPYRLRVHHLPPIILSFQLPATYPTTDPPKFQLRCMWLHPHEVRMRLMRVV